MLFVSHGLYTLHLVAIVLIYSLKMKFLMPALGFQMLNFILGCLATEEKCSGEICIPLHYEKGDLPKRNETNEVGIGISYLRILKIDDYDCIIKSSFWMTMNWKEPRLIVSPNTTKRYIKLDESFYDYLWIPDIVIPNVDVIDMIHFFNNKRELIYIPNVNSMVSTVNVVVETYCSMKFENYPIDNHKCKILFRSASNIASDIKLISGHLKFEKDFNLLDYSFDVQNVPTGSEINDDGLNSSIAGFEIRLQRNINKYIANYYVPSGILVTISWVNENNDKLIKLIVHS